MVVGRRYFRAIESDAGWHCKQGMTRLDAHPSLDEAVDHLSELGEERAPSEIFAHYMDGRVVSVATFD